MLAKFMRRVTRLPGVPQSRHAAERVVAPYLRADLTSLHQDLVALIDRVGRIEERLDGIEQQMPLVLNAIVSTNGNARLTQRELTTVRAELAAIQGAVASIDLDAVTTD